MLLRDGQGKPIEFAGTLTDVTERRQLESQLVQAQKLDAIGKLTGGIAHDFNNLLAAVLGGLGLIERHAELPDEQQKILNMTRRAADQGSELVRRLLAFARRQQLEPAALDIAALHYGVDDLLTHTLGGLVELDWQIAPDMWRAFADRSQLELAVMNLIINARDAMPDGGVIKVVAENRAIGVGADEEPLPPGDYVVISVVDTGAGIPPEMLDKVLEPFFTTKEVGKGTGLGLSMVYGFAKQSGGTLRLDSKVGEGTTAELWLRRATAEEDPIRDEPAADGELDAQRPLRVMLVDDHAEVRGTTAAMLRDMGHAVTEAASGAEALEQMNGSGLDLLITDYAMPRQSGTDVIRLAREKYPALPALLITGYADAEAIGERPADVGVLMKPFLFPDLSRAIQAAVAREPAVILAR